jgi:hypothetical protein
MTTTSITGSKRGGTSRCELSFRLVVVAIWATGRGSGRGQWDYEVTHRDEGVVAEGFGFAERVEVITRALAAAEEWVRDE